MYIILTPFIPYYNSRKGHRVNTGNFPYTDRVVNPSELLAKFEKNIAPNLKLSGRYDTISFMKYITRVTDSVIRKKLEGLGGLMIVGPKWCGKTSTAEQFSNSAIYIGDEEEGGNNIQTALFRPSILLEGATPRLVDEWQLAPNLFDAARRIIDKRRQSGQFIFTGSTTPPMEKTRHSGVGRFSYVRMYPMSLFESGESNGSISLKELFEGKSDLGTASKLSIENLVFCILRGGWPLTLQMKDDIAISVASDYLYALENNEWLNFPEEEKAWKPEKIKPLIQSYSRNIATPASIETIYKDVSETGGSISRPTADAYIQKLQKLYVIDDLPAWNVSLRSKTALRQTPKRHLTDPSLAATAIGATQDKLLRDLNTLGFLFESLCVRDIRVYAAANDCSISFYRDKTELEIDIIIEKTDGTWGAMEVKLGSFQEDEAAKNLITLSKRVDVNKTGDPAFLAILTGGKYPYKRKDGVFVIPIGCLAP